MSRKTIRSVHAGRYAAEVPVDLIPDDDAWGPYLSMDDALKLERVQEALEKGDIARGFARGESVRAAADLGLASANRAATSGGF